MEQITRHDSWAASTLLQAPNTMINIDAFEKYASEYDRWFDDHHYVYESELEALKLLLPGDGIGLEIGVGTGRFALPLGIRLGIEPSKAMREMAQARNIEVINAVAEALPFSNDKFDYIVFVTTVCFLDSMEQAFKEAFRVLKAGGAILIGLIDKDSPLGKEYEKHKNDSHFYKDATFHSVEEVITCLEKSGFGDFRFVETIFHPLAEIVKKEAIKEGYGTGAFVVIRANK